MPSSSLSEFEARLQDVEQILEAHTAVYRQQRIERGMADAKGDPSVILRGIAESLESPGPGRRRGVQAINRAAIVVVNANIEAYIEDVFAEAARHLLDDRMDSVDSYVARCTKTFRSTNPQNVIQLFQQLGITDILSQISWQRMSSQNLKRRLDALVRLRHRIAHGRQPSVNKATVRRARNFVLRLSQEIDEAISVYVDSKTGSNPWP